MIAPRVVGLGGEPATGKSAMMRRLLAEFPAANRFGYGLVNGTIHRTARVTFLVLGFYAPDEPYPGTDRLSMAVMPDAMRLAGLLAGPAPPHGASRIVFEGTRLFCGKFVAHCAALAPGSRFFVLQVDPRTLQSRRAERLDTKPESYLAGCRTKYANLLDQYPSAIKPLRADTEDEPSAFDVFRDAIFQP